MCFSPASMLILDFKSSNTNSLQQSKFNAAFKAISAGVKMYQVPCAGVFIQFLVVWKNKCTFEVCSQIDRCITKLFSPFLKKESSFRNISI